jgi:hypothetical protein
MATWKLDCSDMKQFHHSGFGSLHVAIFWEFRDLDLNLSNVFCDWKGGTRIAHEPGSEMQSTDSHRNAP